MVLQFFIGTILQVQKRVKDLATILQALDGAAKNEQRSTPGN